MSTSPSAAEARILSTGVRGRLFRPVLYPTAIALAFVLAFLDASGVSPYAALRTLLVVTTMTTVVTVASTSLLGDRHRGGVVALLVVLIAVAGAMPLVALLLGAAIALVLGERILSRRRLLRIRWPIITRVLGTVTAILLLAIAIRVVQDGRALQAGRDVIAEAPFRPAAATASPANPSRPDVYLVLLDGYPRSDKLRDDFGVDNTAFEAELIADGFTIATRSRSNYMQTHLTLAGMLNGVHVGDLVGPAPGEAEWHEVINAAAALEPFRAAGYEIVSGSSGWEVVSLRRVDRFIDTGQINEFERVLIEMTAIEPALDIVAPGFLATNHADRVEATLEEAVELAGEGGPARLTLLHVGSPHAPLAFRPDGARNTDLGVANVFDDKSQYIRLGKTEFGRRLGEQVAYLNGRVAELIRAIDASGRPSVVVVFSDHGSGARYDPANTFAEDVDLDLRSANFLAVRGLPELDARSTLINLLPRIAEVHLGTPFTPQPEDIRIYVDAFERYELYQRPD